MSSTRDWITPCGGYALRVTAESWQQIDSECAHIRKMAEQLQELSAIDELRRPINETSPYQVAGQCGAHAACPVPSAILKAVEVATGMALPADVQIRISRD